MNKQFSSIWPIDQTLSSAITLGWSEPGIDGNEEALRVPQSPALQEPHYFVSYPGHSLGGISPHFSEAVGVFYRRCRQGD